MHHSVRAGLAATLSLVVLAGCDAAALRNLANTAATTPGTQAAANDYKSFAGTWYLVDGEDTADFNPRTGDLTFVKDGEVFAGQGSFELFDGQRKSLTKLTLRKDKPRDRKVGISVDFSVTDTDIIGKVFDESSGTSRQVGELTGAFSLAADGKTKLKLDFTAASQFGRVDSPSSPENPPNPGSDASKPNLPVIEAFGGDYLFVFPSGSTGPFAGKTTGISLKPLPTGGLGGVVLQEGSASTPDVVGQVEKVSLEASAAGPAVKVVFSVDNRQFTATYVTAYVDDPAKPGSNRWILRGGVLSDGTRNYDFVAGVTLMDGGTNSGPASGDVNVLPFPVVPLQDLAGPWMFRFGNEGTPLSLEGDLGLRLVTDASGSTLTGDVIQIQPGKDPLVIGKLDNAKVVQTAKGMFLEAGLLFDRAGAPAVYRFAAMLSQEYDPALGRRAWHLYGGNLSSDAGTYAFGLSRPVVQPPDGQDFPLSIYETSGAWDLDFAGSPFNPFSVPKVQLKLGPLDTQNSMTPPPMAGTFYSYDRSGSRIEQGLLVDIQLKALDDGTILTGLVERPGKTGQLRINFRLKDHGPQTDMRRWVLTNFDVTDGFNSGYGLVLLPDTHEPLPPLLELPAAVYGTYRIETSAPSPLDGPLKMMLSTVTTDRGRLPLLTLDGANGPVASGTVSSIEKNTDGSAYVYFVMQRSTSGPDIPESFNIGLLIDRDGSSVRGTYFLQTSIDFKALRDEGNGIGHVDSLPADLVGRYDLNDFAQGNPYGGPIQLNVDQSQGLAIDLVDAKGLLARLENVQIQPGTDGQPFRVAGEFVHVRGEQPERLNAQLQLNPEGLMGEFIFGDRVSSFYGRRASNYIEDQASTIVRLEAFALQSQPIEISVPSGVAFPKSAQMRVSQDEKGTLVQLFNKNGILYELRNPAVGHYHETEDENSPVVGYYLYGKLDSTGLESGLPASVQAGIEVYDGKLMGTLDQMKFTSQPIRVPYALAPEGMGNFVWDLPFKATGFALDIYNPDRTQGTSAVPLMLAVTSDWIMTAVDAATRQPVPGVFNIKTEVPADTVEVKVWGRAGVKYRLAGRNLQGGKEVYAAAKVDGEPLTLSLEAATGEPFGGFLLEAADPAGNPAVVEILHLGYTGPVLPPQ